MNVCYIGIPQGSLITVRLKFKPGTDCEGKGILTLH
jgi:hypothetical protein